MTRDEFFKGVKDLSPILLGVLPFSMIVGVTAVNVGIDPLQAIAMSFIMFAGASQLAAIELMSNTAPVPVVVLTALIVNLRFTMYSASLAPYLRDLSTFWKGISAYILSDQAYAVSITEFRRRKRDKTWYYLGAAFILWFTWQTGTILGVMVGSNLPQGLSLEFAVPLTFMALLVPNLEGRASKLTALVAGIVAIAAAELPYNLGLITAALIAMASGAAADWWWSR
ncbi:MAG: AzlC family ABC transporter permease [Archaeoglobaceae archaeon]